MKKTYSLLAAVLLLVTASNLSAQIDSAQSSKKNQSCQQFSKGSSQIGLEHLGVHYAYGRVYGTIGLRYGYFIADNNLLFMNAGIDSYDTFYRKYRLGLNYRHYFMSGMAKPFVQAGLSSIWEDYKYQNTGEFQHSFRKSIEGNIGGGVSFQIRRFGFEAGMQLRINGDNTNLAPKVGVSFTF